VKRYYCKIAFIGHDAKRKRPDALREGYGKMGIVGCEKFAVGGKSVFSIQLPVFSSREEEYRSRDERE